MEVEGSHNKLFLSIFIVLVFILVSFSVANILHLSVSEYKISIIHNGKPIYATDPSSIYHNFGFGLYFYNNASYCDALFNETQGTTNSATHIFDGNALIGDVPLSNYENKMYAVSPYIWTESSANGIYIAAYFQSKDTYNPVLNYQELLKLTKNFSFTFDLPIFDDSKSKSFVNLTDNKIYVHANLIDNWPVNATFLCVARREYASGDLNQPNCNESSYLFIKKNLQCSQTYLSKCGLDTNKVIYLSQAVRNGTNIDCSFSKSDLSPNKTYDVLIFVYPQLNENLYIQYRYGKLNPVTIS